MVAPVNNKKNEVCIAFHANLVGDRNRIFGMVQTVTLLTAGISLRDLPDSNRQRIIITYERTAARRIARFRRRRAWVSRDCKQRSKNVARRGACVTVEKSGALNLARRRVSKTCSGITVTSLTPREVTESVHEHGILERSASPGADRRTV